MGELRLGRDPEFEVPDGIELKRNSTTKWWRMPIRNENDLRAYEQLLQLTFELEKDGARKPGVPGPRCAGRTLGSALVSLGRVLLPQLRLTPGDRERRQGPVQKRGPTQSCCASSTTITIRLTTPTATSATSHFNALTAASKKPTPWAM